MLSGPMSKPKARKPKREVEGPADAAPIAAAPHTFGTAQTYIDIRLAQAGDPVALNRLFERYYPRVRTIARSRLGPKLEQFVEPDDIVQDALYEALSSFNRFKIRHDSSFLAYLARIVERRIIAWSRKVNGRDPGAAPRPRVLPLDVRTALNSGSSVLEPAATRSGPFERIQRHEQIERMIELLPQLPKHYREIILFRFVIAPEPDGTWDDVSRLSGTPNANAARVLCVRAVNRLGKLMQAENTGADEQRNDGRRRA
jgi:RNA polymerase sigma factor (sigma-70 family)